MATRYQQQGPERRKGRGQRGICLPHVHARAGSLAVMAEDEKQKKRRDNLKTRAQAKIDRRMNRGKKPKEKKKPKKRKKRGSKKRGY